MKVAVAGLFVALRIVAFVLIVVLMVLTVVFLGICFLRMCHARRAIGKSAYLRPREWTSELWDPMSPIDMAWVRAYLCIVISLSIIPPACGMIIPSLPLAGFNAYSFIFACYVARS